MVDVEGNIYETVIIGEQEWMAENLKTTRYKDGSDIKYPGNLELMWIHDNSGAYAWYDNDIAWKDIYGALYNWYAVNNEKGLCPAGWRVPNDDDWTQLVNYVVSQGFPNEESNPNGAGNALKSCRQVNSPLGGECDTSEHPRWNEDIWSGNNHHGFDEFGFMALPGGGRNFDDAQYHILATDCFFWSSIQSQGISFPTAMSLYFTSGNIMYFEYAHKNSGISVRCIKDND